MKGFNLAPPGTPGMATLPPVAEFMTSFQSTDNPDFYNILNSNIMPRRNHMYSMQQFSSSQSSFSESFGTMSRLGKLGSKLRHNSQKRRWGKFRTSLLYLSLNHLVIKLYCTHGNEYLRNTATTRARARKKVNTPNWNEPIK